MKENILAILRESESTGKPVNLTQRVAHNTPDKSFTQKDGYAEKVITAAIADIEDRGQYYYVSYIPLRPTESRYGYFRLFKSKAKNYGIVAVNGESIYSVEEPTLAEVREALKSLMGNPIAIESKIAQLRNIVASTRELDFAEETIDCIVGMGYVRCEMTNAMSEYYDNFTALGNLIAGITDWSAKYFYLNGCGNLEDLTDDKLNLLIEEILLQIESEDE